MSSSIDYLEYVLDLLRNVDNISYKKMMGEFLLYKDNKLFGGIYDNRFLVKITNSLKEYGFNEEIPYPNGKKMYLIDIENPDLLKEIIDKLVNEL